MARPTTPRPSAVIPYRDWKLCTELRVCGPKSPSAVTPSLLCNAATREPEAPYRTTLTVQVGAGAVPVEGKPPSLAHVSGPTMPSVARP
ncbi:hypothetical protein LVQ62_04435 [Allobranchiibius sp. GilTou73]|nr:hypothetical protein [Allobranchiibius sp. GilTou73]UIJ35638.1 hypothetical protein LVQ62_04435 [Allobranchiibius sp. GilTou73]